MSSGFQLRVKSVENREIVSEWRWPPEITRHFNTSSSQVQTFIRVFHPNDVLLRTVRLPDPRSTLVRIRNIDVDSVRVCLNLTVHQSAPPVPSAEGPPLPTTANASSSYSSCIEYSSAAWSVPLGSSLAAFLVLSLVVVLILFVKRLGQKRRRKRGIAAHRKSSARKQRNSYMFVYSAHDDDHEDDEEDEEDDNHNDLEEDEAAMAAKMAQFGSVAGGTLTTANEDSGGELPSNSSELDEDDEDDEGGDAAMVTGIQSDSNDESSGPKTEQPFDHIIQCDCGLIHLVGTEGECDNFLLEEHQSNDELAPQDQQVSSASTYQPGPS